jgi:hypothetical protein
VLMRRRLLRGRTEYVVGCLLFHNRVAKLCHPDWSDSEGALHLIYMVESKFNQF